VSINKINLPVPVFVRAPEVEAAAPLIVKLVARVETSIVPVVPAVIVKFLSVEAVAPVYFKVPPPNTRLVAALVAEPRLPLATPPFPIVATLNVPALIVVTPV
jgi:hypothetical protein